MKNNKNFRSNFRNLIIFLVESVIVIVCYLIQKSIWRDNLTTPSFQAGLLIIFSILFILLASLMLQLFIKRLSLDKKILISLGFTAIALGILGFSDLIMKNNISFVDAVYRTFQLFVGEFNDIPHEPGEFPVMLNISRFLALFVTFGAISVLLLREKLAQLNIRLFYKDVVIITDAIDKQVTALSEKLSMFDHKVLLGLISPVQEISFKSNEQIPVIEFDIDKTLHRGLVYCNIKKAQSIYLLCSQTSDNIVLFKSINRLLKGKKTAIEKDSISDNTSVLSHCYDDAVRSLSELLKTNGKTMHRKKEKEKQRKCFIKFQTQSEREYYSIDSSLSDDRGNFEIFFINTISNALRQMISRIDLGNFIDGISCEYEKTIRSLNNIKIGVAGSGELLVSAFRELPRLCTFGNSPVITLYNFSPDSYTPGNTASINIVPVDTSSPSSVPVGIDMMFLCSESEIHIKNILQDMYQKNHLDSIREIIILTEGNSIEFKILGSYIHNLAEHYRTLDKDSVKPVVHLANTVDLLMSIDDFYSVYGPDIHIVHDSYRKAMKRGILRNFRKLPEELIESNLMASIHNALILKLIKSLVFAHDIQMLKSFIDFFASVEHERWFRERILQGYVLSDEHDYLFNKNPYLMHWESLDEDIKQKNRLYLTEALISLVGKPSASESDDILGNFITTMDFRVPEVE